MHELSIAISLVEAAEEEAQNRGVASVYAVHLKLGPLSGVEKDALLFSYDLVTEGTLLEGSKLIVEEMPVMIFCPSCGEPRPIRSAQSFCCAMCNTPAGEIVQGKELEVIALEISP